MKSAVHIQAKSDPVLGGRKNFFHGQHQQAPFFNKPEGIQKQAETGTQESSVDLISETAPKVFTKPKVFWVLENERSKDPARALYSTETTTAEQLAHTIFKSPETQINAMANVNGVTPDQSILPYSKIKIPRVNVSGTSWAQQGYNNSLRFNGSGRNPFPILETMGVSSVSGYVQKKIKIDEELKMELPMMTMFIGVGMEDKFLQLLRKYANSNFTDHPDRYVGGGQYVDKIFTYLRGKMKRIGYFDEITSYYDLIFNHFNKANEVRQIRELYSEAYKGDDGIKEVSYGAIFLEEAFYKALSVAGVPKQEIMGFLNKAGDALSEIISSPKKFLKNLMAAVKQGFNLFKTSLPSLLGTGLLKWVLGKVGKGSIEMPKDFSVKSILKLALQLLQIDIKAIVTEVIGPKNIERIEKVWGIVRTFMSKGIGGLVDQLISYAGDLKKTLLAKFKDWLIKDVLKSAISELLQMFIPGGGLVKVVKKIYGVIQFVRSKLAELKNLFVTVGQSVLQIVKGDTSTAANKINQVLTDGLYLLIDLLARLLKINFLDGIRSAIQNLGKTIRTAIKKLIEKLVVGGKRVIGKVAGWLGFRKEFTTNSGAPHVVYISEEGGLHNLIIESSPINVTAFLKQKKEEVLLNDTLENNEKKAIIGKIRHTKNLLKGLGVLMNKSTDQDNSRIPKMIFEIIDNIKEIDINEEGENEFIPKAEFNPDFRPDIRATSFSARYVSNAPGNHAPGTKAKRNAFTDAWQVLIDMRLNNKWTRFHILNQGLGGIGEASNLIPAPKYINDEYEDKFEKHLKAYYANNLPIWLNATIDYDRSNFNGYFPSFYVAEGGAMKFENDNWVQDSARWKQFSTQIDKPESHSFNINEIMNDPKEDTLIINLTNVTQATLNILRNGMPAGGYTNSRQMERVIEIYLYGDLSKEIGSFDEVEMENLPKPTSEQIRKANKLKNKLRSAHFTFE